MERLECHSIGARERGGAVVGGKDGDALVAEAEAHGRRERGVAVAVAELDRPVGPQDDLELDGPTGAVGLGHPAEGHRLGVGPADVDVLAPLSRAVGAEVIPEGRDAKVRPQFRGAVAIVGIGAGEVQEAVRADVNCGVSGAGVGEGEGEGVGPGAVVGSPALWGAAALGPTGGRGLEGQDAPVIGLCAAAGSERGRIGRADDPRGKGGGSYLQRRRPAEIHPPEVARGRGTGGRAPDGDLAFGEGVAGLLAGERVGGVRGEFLEEVNATGVGRGGVGPAADPLGGHDRALDGVSLLVGDAAADDLARAVDVDVIDADVHGVELVAGVNVREVVPGVVGSGPAEVEVVV